MKLGLSLLTLLLVAPQQSTPSLERVRFDWPVGVNASVTTNYVSETRLDGVSQRRTELRMTHRMRVLEDQAGRVLENAEHRPVHSSGEVTSALSALIALWIPRTVISDTGEFVRIEQAERIQGLLFDIYAPRANDAAALAVPAFKEFLQQMTAGDALSRLGASEWMDTVGKWVGIPLDAEPIDGRGAIGLGGGVSVPTAIRQAMIERGPCVRPDLAPDCATFEIRQTLTPEGLTAFKDFANRGATADVASAITFVEVVESAKVEVATMLPHDVVIDRTMRRTIDVNGKSVTVEDVERRTMHYTYAGAQ
jgi:hypothetical protein